MEALIHTMTKQSKLCDFLIQPSWHNVSMVPNYGDQMKKDTREWHTGFSWPQPESDTCHPHPYLITWDSQYSFACIYDQHRQHIKKQRHYFADKGPFSQSCSFSSSHVYMWELDYKEGWAPKNWYFWTVVLEKTLESPFDCKEIQPVYPKGDQSWVFIGITDAKAETPILWPPHAKSWLIGKDWCWEGLGAGGEGDDRGWDGWMASPTQWTWVWVDSGSWW